MPLFSHTKLSTYESCPRQYKYRYVEKLKSDFQTIEQYMGKRVHEALEKLHRGLQMGREADVGAVIDDYHSSWEANWSDSVKVVKKDHTAQDYRKVGVECISNYFASGAPLGAEEEKTVALEKKILVRLAGDYSLNGVIDRLSIKNGVYGVHDYKTSSQLPSQGDVDSDRQLAFYHLGVQEEWPDAGQVELVWHFLRFAKQLRSRRTEAALDLVRLETVQKIKKIESAQEEDDFPPNPSALCNWCEFKSMCPAWGGSSAQKQMRLSSFEPAEPTALVDSYARAKQSARELEEKIEKLEQALIEYSAKTDCGVIMGSNGTKLGVSRTQATVFPARHSPGREELESLLKQSGLWQEASTLDSSALSKLLEKQGIPRELADRIASLSTTQTRVTLRLGKLRGTDGHRAE